MKTVLYGRGATKALAKISEPDRSRIVEKIDALAEEPKPENLDIAKLVDQDGYRLRHGNWRIIFEESETEIKIMRVAPRGSAYR